MRQLSPGLVRGLTVTAVVIALQFILLGLGKVDLSTPFEYTGDALSSSATIQTVLEKGSYFETDRLGAPFGAKYYDFPMAEGVNFVLIGLIGALSNWSFALNGYFLLTYVLIALAALYALRKMGVQDILAIVLAVLYAFLPYHLNRGEHHLFLSGYFMVPLLCWAIWVVSQGVWIERDGAFQKKLAIQLALISLVGSSTGIYYAFFAAMALGFFSVVTWINTRHHRNLLASLALVAILGAGTFINLLPSLFNSWLTQAPIATQRPLGDAETYGLKLAQLILPRPGHNFPPAAHVRDFYNSSAPLSNENNSAALGLLGALGLLASLGAILLRRGGNEKVAELGKINGFLLLVATIGGLAVLVGLLLTKEIRAYNRISVFIGFFSLAAVGFLASMLLERWQTKKWSLAATLGLSVGLLGLGLYDQVPLQVNLSGPTALVQMDRQFFQKVEASITPGSAVFQLPYVPYPENPTVVNMNDYEHFRAYLNTKTIRWSYGAFKNSEGAQKISQLALESEQDWFLKDLVVEGYSGLYINRDGYADQAVALEQKISRQLGLTPLTSSDGKLLFFSLEGLQKTLMADTEEWKKALQAKTDERAGFYVPGTWIGPQDEALLGDGWSGLEPTHRWTEGKVAELILSLRTPHQSGSVIFEIEPTMVLDKQVAEVSVNGTAVGTIELREGSLGRLVIPGNVFEIPGVNHVKLKLPHATKPGNGDQRLLSFALGRLRLDYGQ